MEDKVKIKGSFSEYSRIIDEFFAREAELFRKEHPEIIEKVLKEQSKNK